MRATARAIAASSVTCVVSTTGTEAPGSLLRPRCSMDSIETCSSRKAAATPAITPGRSSTVRRT